MKGQSGFRQVKPLPARAPTGFVDLALRLIYFNHAKGISYTSSHHEYNHHVLFVIYIVTEKPLANTQHVANLQSPL